MKPQLAIRKAALASIAIGAMLASAGCSTAQPEGAAKEINVLVESGGKQELQEIAALYKEEQGVTVNLVELPYSGVFDRLTSEMTSGGASFDVAAVDAPWISIFKDLAVPLDDMFTEEVQSDLFPALVAEAQADGQFVAMPAWTNAEILLYRKDLFEDPKQQENFKAEYGYDLVVPTTWEEFTDVARFFTQDTDGDGETDLFGTDVKGAVPDEWLAHVLQAGSEGVVLDSEGNVIIDNDAHLEAFKFYSDLNNEYHVSPEGVAQVDWAAAQNLFYQGKTAMLRFWAHAYKLTPEDSVVFDKVGAAPMIGGAGGVGAIPGPWYLMVPNTTSKKTEALDFVQFVYDHNEMAIESPLGLAARVSAFEAYKDKPGYEHFSALLDTLAAPATAGRPANPHWQEIADTVITPLLQASLVEGADYEKLLADARTQVEAIIAG